MKNDAVKIKAFFWSFVLLSITIFSCTENKENPADFKIGVALYSFHKFSFDEAVTKAKSANVNYVEGFSFHDLGSEFDHKSIIDLTDQELDKLKRFLSSNQVLMPSLYVDAKSEEDWRKLFIQAEKLGLSFFVGEPEPQFLDLVNQLAGEHNVQFGIHEHAQSLSLYWHPDSALAAIKGRENLKVCADIGHWVRSGLDPVECLEKVAGNVISVHVKDLDSFGNINANDVSIGEGIIDYPKIITALKSQGFSGYMYVECEHDWDNNLQDVKESVSYITDMSK